MQSIGIVPVDKKTFPNLALMKISAYHKSIGDKVEVASPLFGIYDTVYKSKIFSFTPDDEQIYNTKNIVLGGTGYNNNKLENKIEHICPDYEIFNCDHAYGFLTRGCPNKCSWCIVPEKEGDIKANTDIDEFISDKKSAVLMDNNVLASEHGIKQIEKIIEKKIKVDFNQGLDARLIDDTMAKLLSKVKWLKPLRMACDSSAMISPVKKAVKLLRKNNCTPKYYFCYVLIKDIDESLERINIIKDLGMVVYAQAFYDFKNNIKPTRELEMLSRYCISRSIYNMTWDQFKIINKV